MADSKPEIAGSKRAKLKGLFFPHRRKESKQKKSSDGRPDAASSNVTERDNDLLVSHLHQEEEHLARQAQPITEYLPGAGAKPDDIELVIQPGASKIAPKAENPTQNIWNEAWEDLRNEDGGLVKDYETCIETAASQSSSARNIMSGLLHVHSSAIGFSGLETAQKAQIMKALIEERIHEMVDNKWKFKIGENQLVVKDFVQPVVGIIEWAKDFIGSAVEASPSASLAWGGVSLLLPLLLNPSKQDAARASGLERIAALLRQCSIREIIYYDAYNKRAKSATSLQVFDQYYAQLKILYVKILAFQAKVLRHLMRSTASRAAREMTALDDWDGLLQQIQDHRVQMELLEVQWREFNVLEQWNKELGQHEKELQKLNSISEELTRIKNILQTAQSSKVRQELLEWLSSEHFSTRYNDIRERYQDDTGIWLLESNLYKDWKIEAGSLLWLNGKAGSGKSYLSSSVIYDLMKTCRETPYQAIAYYHFNFTRQPHQDTSALLRTIIRQICAERPDTPQWLLDLAFLFRDKRSQPSVKDLEELLNKAVDGFDAVYLVVDALDECTSFEDKRENMLKSLSRIKKNLFPNVHLFVTSRKEPDIEAQIFKFMSEPSTFEINLNSRHFFTNMNRDINVYLDAKLAEFDWLSSQDKNLAKTKLLEKAGGMFQYVSLQLVSISENFSDVNDIITNLHHGLEQTYARMLAGIDPRYAKEAQRILLWIALSKVPLNAKELAEAAVIDPSLSAPFHTSKRLRYLAEPSRLRKLLPGLIVEVDTGDGNGPEVQFAHFSVQEFLLSSEISAIDPVSTYRIREYEGHLLMAESCLCYHLCIYEDQTVTKHNFSDLYPLWEYVAKYWMDHMNEAPKELWPTILEVRAMSVLQTRSEVFRKQIQVYNPVDDRYDVDDYEDEDEEASTEEHWYPTQAILAPPPYYISGSGNHQILSLYARYVGLKQLKAELNTPSLECYGTALRVASACNDVQMIEILLEYGAEVNSQGGWFGNALQTGAYHGSKESVEILLLHGADVDAHCGEFGYALQAAARAGNEEIVKLLLDAGANVNARGGLYDNVLQAAARAGSRGIVQLVLKEGASVNARGGYYKSALNAAIAGRRAIGRDEGIAIILIKHGADNYHRGTESISSNEDLES